MCRLILYQQDSLPDSVSQYNKLRDSLYVLEGVPIYGRRVIVPRALRQKVILPINAQLKWWTQSSGLESQQTWRTTETVVVFVFHQLSVQLCTQIIKTKINFSNVHREFDEVQIFHPKKDQEVIGSKCNLHYGLSEGFRIWGLSLKEMFWGTYILLQWKMLKIHRNFKWYNGTVFKN